MAIVPHDVVEPISDGTEADPVGDTVKYNVSRWVCEAADQQREGTVSGGGTT